MATTEQPTVEELLDQAGRLDREEQVRLLDGLVQLVQQSAGQQRTPITALRGLGRHVWDEIDAREYVEGERQAWGG